MNGMCGEREFLKDDTGRREILYHATGADFDGFDMAYLVSAGCHFGCPEQANFVAKRYTAARIFPVHLKFRKLIRIRNDLGWLWPNKTIHGLFASGIFDADDTAALGWRQHITAPLAHAADLQLLKMWPDLLAEKCKAFNRETESRLRMRGIDGIEYPNVNEPDDGRKRTAYLVLYPEQIYSAISGECLGVAV